MMAVVRAHREKACLYVMLYSEEAFSLASGFSVSFARVFVTTKTFPNQRTTEH